jgi:WD40 repeat protein
MKTNFILYIFIILFSTTHIITNGQSGTSKTTSSGGDSFWIEPLWGKQIDPRWEAGKVIGDVEDGITVEFVEFSPNGKLLVTGNGQGEVFILNATDGTIRNKFTYITAEDVSRIDSQIVSKISGGFTKSLEVECGAFTTDNQFVVVGGNLNGIKVYDVHDGTLVKHIKYDEIKEEVDGLSVSPDGRFFAYASFRSAKVYNINNWNMLQSVEYRTEGEGSVVNSIDFTKDGSLMILAGNAGYVPLVKTSDWKVFYKGSIPDPSSIKSVRFSPDGKYLAAGNGGGEIVVWNSQDMSFVNQYSSMNYIEAVAWSTDGKYLMAGSRDDGEGRMLVFRTSDWQMVANPEVMADGASIEYIDVNNDLIAVSGEDAHVRLYRIKKQ